MKNHVGAFIDEGNDAITIAQLYITTSHGEVSGARVSLIQGSFSDKLTVKLPGISKYVGAFIDEGNDVITITQLYITTSHGEVFGARVSLIQGSFSDKLTVKLPGISKYGVDEGKPFP